MTTPARPRTARVCALKASVGPVLGGLVAAAVSGCSADSSAAGSGDVSWRDAADHAGDVVRVCGPLKSTGSDGDDRFFNLGAPYPEEPRFTIVVWDNPASVEDVDPERVTYRACVSGEVSMYDGVPQIELDDGGDITLTRR
jgi:hypothetical protein